MKSLQRTISVLVISMLTMLTTALPANAADLNVIGATLQWKDSLYKSDSCSSYDFDYRNGTGIRLLSLEMLISDAYGRKLADGAKIGIDNGLFGTFNVQICRTAFQTSQAPYTIKLSIEDYAGSQRQASKEIVFQDIPGSSSGTISTSTGLGTISTSSAASIAQIAQLQSQLASMQVELAALKAKLGKICKNKPKPKGC